MKPSHRKSMFRNMARSMVTHERIRTTEIRAKELCKVVDSLVTLALRNDLHARRQAYKVLENHQLVQKLFDEIGPRFAGVNGGFTRVVKLGQPRRGDCAAMAVIEFSLLAGEKPAAKTEEKPAGEAKPKKAPAKKTAAAKKEEAPAEEAEAKPKKAPAKKKAAPKKEEAPAEEAAATEEQSAEEKSAEEKPAEKTEE